MGSAEEETQLSLLSLPSIYRQQQQQKQKYAGSSTPPIHTLASVPFQWEEAPGRPRRCMTRPPPSGTTAARCLELPPRLFEAKATNNMPSPTTVLDGPYYSNINNNCVEALAPPPPRTLSRSLSFGKGRSSSFENLGSKVSNQERVVFRSTRWSSSFRRSRDVDEYNYGSGYHPSKVKITRVKRRSSFFISFPSSRSHLWSSVYESFKQVVPWRRT